MADKFLNTTGLSHLWSKITTLLSGKQNLISNPTANKILVDSSTGQAVESSVSISDVATQSDLSGKQDALVSGTNIKTVNNTSLLGSGNVAVQPTLVSGTNIRTINNTSVLGSGNLVLVQGVKGNAESSYRAGNVNLTPANIGAQPALTAGDGISISNDVIKNQFTYLNAVDLGSGSTLSDDVPTNLYVGYCYNVTNKPSGSSTFGWLIAVSGGGRQGQTYYDLYKNKIWYRRYYGGTWNDWVRIDNSYVNGDTYAVPGNYQIFSCYVYTPSGSNNVRFYIPVDKTIEASSVTCDKLTLTLQTATNAGNAFLISGVDVKAASGYTVSCSVRNNGIYVDLKCPSSISLTNRDIGTVILGYSTFTFS